MRNLPFSWLANISVAVNNGQSRDMGSIGGKPQNEDNQTNGPTQNAKMITHTPPKHRR
jgi:hypothetical protein